jgi:hypothetical protein
MIKRYKLAALMFAAATVLGCESEPLQPVSLHNGDVQASRNANELPLRGTFTSNENFVIAFPNLFSSRSATGTAAQLGQYSATYTPVVDLLTGAAAGTFTIIAANGDELSGTFTGQGVPAGPDASNITEIFTITGGTGRFAAATGTIIIQRTLTFTGPTTASSVGSLSGTINLNQE